jgi:hypothetical protein
MGPVWGGETSRRKEGKREGKGGLVQLKYTVYIHENGIMKPTVNYVKTGGGGQRKSNTDADFHQSTSCSCM